MDKTPFNGLLLFDGVAMSYRAKMEHVRDPATILLESSVYDYLINCFADDGVMSLVMLLEKRGVDPSRFDLNSHLTPQGRAFKAAVSAYLVSLIQSYKPVTSYANCVELANALTQGAGVVRYLFGSHPLFFVSTMAE